VSGLVAFAFESQLVRAVRRDDAPWFVGNDVCQCLGLKNPRTSLDLLDADERGVCIVDTPGGEQTVIVVSEPGVYRLVFRSRKPEAERFKRWLAHEVLPNLRRGDSLDPVSPSPPAEPRPERLAEVDLRHAPLLHRLQCIREVRSVAGVQAARVMWQRLGLPPLPPPPLTAADEARQCLRHLLEAEIVPGGPQVRAAIELALDDDFEAQAMLIGAGLRVVPDREAFIVANDHIGLRRIFAGTDWHRARSHMWVLRRLPGVAAGRQYRYGDEIQRRGTLVPASLLDEP
jgi:hypothetical protein